MVLGGVWTVAVRGIATSVTARASVVSATDRENVRVAEKGIVTSVEVQASASSAKVQANVIRAKGRADVQSATEKEE